MSKILKEVLQLSTEWLAKSKSDSPRFEAEWLIGHALGLSRIQLYTQHDRTLMENELDKVRTLLRRRVAGEPLQYICGEMDFYGLTLLVGPGVLIPRNDTEILVDHARRLLKAGDRVLDLCTGSACIPLALQKSFKGGLSIDAGISHQKAEKKSIGGTSLAPVDSICQAAQVAFIGRGGRRRKKMIRPAEAAVASN